jgi:hypothetical protein
MRVSIPLTHSVVLLSALITLYEYNVFKSKSLLDE